MYKTGDTPGAGRYVCTNCGRELSLASDSEALPACPRCGNRSFNKEDE